MPGEDEFGLMIRGQSLRGMTQLLTDFNQVKSLEAPSHSVLVSPDGTVDPALSIADNGAGLILGNFTVGDGGGGFNPNPTIQLDGETGNRKTLRYRTAGSNRWIWRTTNTAESGGNAGSDFEVLRRTDAGGALGTAIFIERSTGHVGFGVSSPQGKIHSYDTISGFINWEFDGLDATIRTIIPNGTGDALYRLTALFVLRNSAGAVASGTTDVSNGASVSLVVGADTVRLRVNADGSVDTSRTAGVNTIKVAYTLRWL